MCTVTVIPIASPREGRGFRLVTNRDERRERLAALAPEIRRVGAVRAVWPVDPVGGGTWVCANDRGVALTLLNVNRAGLGAPEEAARFTSRGALIPELVDVSRAADAIKRLGGLDLGCFRAFRLVVVDAGTIFEAGWDRRTLRVERRPMAPACFVSSGLGDERAAPRLELWARFLREAAAGPEMQDVFHRHQWPDRPEISVLMSRADARTVSTTALEIRRVGGGGRARVLLRHFDDAGTVVRRLEPDGARAGVSVAPGEPVRC